MIEQILNWMKHVEIGEGDLTTESIAPYPLHSSGRLVMSSDTLFSGRAIMEKLLESAGKQLQVAWLCNEGDEIPAGASIFEF